jgi:hypothetical protein
MIEESKSQTTQSITPSTGVVLLAFGKPQYFWMVYNIAYSIKRANKNIKIALVSDIGTRAVNYVPELSQFIDLHVELQAQDMYTNKKLDPGKAKVLLYDYLPFDNNLYLDVDGVCLKDLQPLIDTLVDSGIDYGTSIHGTHTLDHGRDFKQMVWSYADEFINHFNIKEDAMLYGINSSVQFIKKGDVCANLFKVAADQFINNPMPLHKLRMKWGGGQPDELYFNAALCLTETTPHNIEAVCFQMKRELTFDQIENSFYVMSYYGGKRFTPMFYIEWLDRLMKSWMQQDGKKHNYLFTRITDYKYVDGKK